MQQTADVNVEIQSPLVLVEDDVRERELDAETALTMAREFEVVGLRSYEVAVDAVQRLRTQKASVVEFFEPMAKAANALHKSITGRRGEVVNPIEAAIKVLEGKIGVYRAEQKRIADEKARAERRRIEAEERARREVEALAAADADDELGFARAVRDSEAPVAIPESVTAPAIVETTAPKVAGMRETTKWKARLKTTELVDEDLAVRKLCRSIADGYTSVSFIEPCWDVLEKYATLMKGTVTIPGIEFYSETKTTVSRARS